MTSLARPARVGDRLHYQSGYGTRRNPSPTYEGEVTKVGRKWATLVPDDSRKAVEFDIQTGALRDHMEGQNGGRVVDLETLTAEAVAVADRSTLREHGLDPRVGANREALHVAAEALRAHYGSMGRG